MHISLSLSIYIYIDMVRDALPLLPDHVARRAHADDEHLSTIIVELSELIILIIV